MNESNQSFVETSKGVYYEDEIELIDIIRIIWKWRYLILAGTILCGLITAIISFNMRKIYRITMILRPGILSVGEQGDKAYIDSPQDIEDLIQSGILNNDILSYLKDIKMRDIPKKIKFDVVIPLKSNNIKVEYETADIEQGVFIQNRLGQLLLEHYGNLVSFFKNRYDIKLKSLKSEIEYINATIQSKKRNVKNLEKRIDELNAESKIIKKNTDDLIRERDKLLSENTKEKNVLPSLVYSNTIQQNLQLSNNYQNDINNYKQQKENELQDIEKAENDIANRLNESNNLQDKKNYIQNLQILQPQSKNLIPIKPKPTLNIFLGLSAGFIFFIFLTFLLEYISKHKSLKNDRL